ncbi:metallophosphoesterase family protein [Methyloceanibacter caenitepidi]|uniref:Putative phosphohydrolases, Icc family n=1 Tax=Methyloceanibacter caenitepidi TaxID=1384459 RepID=A0A0A8K859_9HYPH|nr:metallophosphoesterase [Methyloceanibacter caenitepidi]BAQ18179.1 putative phosphohydrolases, Icc family [Methyloceanibacter caenitepidi]
MEIEKVQTAHVFTLAHMSDIHLGPLPKVKSRQLLSKRLLGYVNWHRGRKFVHRRDILDLLTNDLKERGPDHIAVTGDLTNLGLPQEFPLTADWLRNLGSPDDVTVIPGNHDAYVRINPDKATAHWRPFMQGNESGQTLYEQVPGEFPFVRRFGDIALIGLSSAISTAPFLAAGRLGGEQRRALAEILDRLGRDGLFRVVLIHHPPLPGQAGWRRGLRDAAEVRDVLRDHGAELVLHGHNHEQSLIECETVSGPAIVVGAPSASEAVDGRIPAARYNEYAIERAGNGWRVEMTGRAATRNGDVRESEKRVIRSR